MPGLTYTSYLSQVATMAVVETSDINFLSIAPEMIAYAELRLQRDLDFMQFSTALHGSSYALTEGDRRLSFSQNLDDGSSFVVSEQINLILPAGNTNPDNSERVALTPTTKEFLDAVYGSSLSADRGQPKYYVPFNEADFLVGPVPDQDYRVEVVGTIWAAPLGYLPAVTNLSHGGLITFASAHGLTGTKLLWLNNFTPTAWNGGWSCSRTSSTQMQIVSPPSPGASSIEGAAAYGNSQSFISEYFPDLFVMASMIYISAYQRNFGRQADDPQMAQSYESQYQLLLKSAGVEEARKKYEASGWTSQSPAPVASPSRG